MFGYGSPTTVNTQHAYMVNMVGQFDPFLNERSILAEASFLYFDYLTGVNWFYR